MINTTKSIREDILKRLVDLAVRDRKPDIAEQFRSEAEFLISLLEKEILRGKDDHHEKGKYAKCKRAIDGIRIILEELGRPASQKELTKRLIEGGFRGGSAGTDQVINLSIKNFLTGSGKNKSYIKQIGGLIGLAEWDNSRFKG
jgi:hypothetical protein